MWILVFLIVYHDSSCSPQSTHVWLGILMEEGKQNCVDAPSLHARIVTWKMRDQAPRKASHRQCAVNAVNFLGS